MIRRRARLFSLISCLVCHFSLKADVDLNALSAHIASNITAKMAKVVTARTNAVLAIASPENYAILTSSNLKNAAKKLALQKQLAQAVLADIDLSENSRLKWHGPCTSQIVDLEKCTSTRVHQDGTKYTVSFSRPNLAAQVKAYNARLPLPPMTNGIPRALAAARLRRYQELLTPTQCISTVTHANSR